MTPEDLSAVQRSWPEFVRLRGPLHEALTGRFDAVASTQISAAERAAWLFAAVDALVGLLSAPSCLATRARDVGATWPDPLSAPSFAVEGRAWMGAAAECIEGWTPTLEQSWRQAWILLSDVLAAETLSPFADEPHPGASAEREGGGKTGSVPSGGGRGSSIDAHHQPPTTRDKPSGG
jgi:hypothetical protein